MASSNHAAMPDAHLAHAFLWPFKWALKATLLIGGMAILVMIIFEAISYLSWGADSERFAEQSYQAIVISTLDGDEPSLTTRLGALLAHLLYWVFFKATSVHQAMEQFADPAPVNLLDSAWRNGVIVPYQSEIRIAMWAVQIFAIRLAVLLSAVPLLAVAYAVAFVDGLAERSVRRACAGRESSGLYHRAKYLQLTSGAFCVLVYLCAPWPLDPRWTLLPFVVVFGLLTRMQWKYYKKYM